MWSQHGGAAMLAWLQLLSAMSIVAMTLGMIQVCASAQHQALSTMHGVHDE